MKAKLALTILALALCLPGMASATHYELTVRYKACGRWMTARYNYKSPRAAQRARYAFLRAGRFNVSDVRVAR